jgi:UDP:flavonoid glycosyltransferase YjiC (YdhE family)
MIAYHIPVRGEFGNRLGAKAWNALLLGHLRLIVATHHPAVLVYDGVSPYDGLMKALGEGGFRHTAMILRLRHKHNRLAEWTEQLALFDELIFPGEAGVTVPAEFAALQHRVCDPIVYLDRAELLPRADVRERWNIAPDKKVVYVQLGAANINDTAAWTERVVQSLQRRGDVEVVLAESPIAERASDWTKGVRVLHHYPNSLFFNGVDLAITAAGYNTFHELMHFGVPAIFIPNEETITDDQLARARTAADVSAACVVSTFAELDDALHRTLDENTARHMRENAMALVPRNGALSAAECLCQAARSGLAVSAP